MRHTMSLASVLALVLLTAACASRTIAPPLPSVPRYVEYVFPAVPDALSQAPGAALVGSGWRFLQNGDLRNAEREFGQALRQSPTLYPARAGAGYVSLARGEYDGAVAAFDAALQVDPGYVPALVGRGQTLLALTRDDEALVAFEAALAVDAELAGLARRVDLLRFRRVQDVIAAARTAAAEGRPAEARAAYARALETTPDSAFLHRELGVLEREDGHADAALDHFRRAAALDPADVDALLQIGALLEARQDFAGAEAALRRAAEIEPTVALRARIAAVGERRREAGLPAAFRVIPTAAAITRGDLAALVGVRLETLLSAVPRRQVVATDVTGHWAATWITMVAQTGIMDPFDNHTFQPGAGVRRGDLAAAVSRLVALVAAGRPDLRSTLGLRPPIADMAPGHLSYPAAAVAVAAGILPLLDGGRFDVGRAVSGAEALEALDRIRALADASR